MVFVCAHCAAVGIFLTYHLVFCLWVRRCLFHHSLQSLSVDGGSNGRYGYHKLRQCEVVVPWLENLLVVLVCSVGDAVLVFVGLSVCPKIRTAGPGLHPNGPFLVALFQRPCNLFLPRLLDRIPTQRENLFSNTKKEQKFTPR